MSVAGPPRLRALPTRAVVWATLALALACAVALFAGAAMVEVGRAALGGVALGLLLCGIDLWHSRRQWRAAGIGFERRLPHALAIGVARELPATLRNPGSRAWRVQVVDHVDPTLRVTGWPRTLTLAPGEAATLASIVTPTRRGTVRLDPAELRVRGRLGCVELIERLGPAQALPVYPNFAALARYAWLAGDRRLDEIGIKTATRRGEGTDFKQLAEYRVGDEVRHIDWKATLRARRPIVREYQDDRDQRVLLLLDCGRRMRAHEGDAAAHGGHFDQALDALMLLAYVALKSGDEVGAMTFGGDAGQHRRFAPRKGLAALDGLVAALHDLQPGLGHADHLEAARQVMLTTAKRSLVVVITNFRSEDVPELRPALQLLRTRHLVLLASLREQALREQRERPLHTSDDAVTVAGAHLFEQQRREAFARLAGRDALLIDVEPQGLAPALVSRYMQVKRAGRL